MTGKLRLGIIGCGNMSDSHTNGLKEVGDIAEFTCCCDIVEERAKKSAESLSAPHYFTNYKDMVDLVDAVLIVLPHELHYEVGMFFINHNKHILMEKPLCNSEEECVNIIKAAQEHGVTLMTAYPVRYWPEIVQLKELVDNKTYGELFQMSIWTEQYTNYENHPWGCSASSLGGGQLFSHGCHYIDILLWFLGRPVSGCHIGTNLGTPWMEREGTSNVSIAFENGALGYHMGTWGARGTQHGYTFQLHCTEGMLEYSLEHGKVLLYQNLKTDYDDEDDQKEPIVLYESEDKSKKTQYELRHFIDCVVNKMTPLTDSVGSLQGLRVIWKLYEAEDQGQLADLRGLGLDQGQV